jgi:hypothetical protein
MAIINGKKFVLLIAGESLVCEQSSAVSFSRNAVELRCKTSGGFPSYLTDTDFTGEISASGLYDAAATQSGIDLAQLMIVGAPVTFVWGGTEVGDEIISGTAVLFSVNLSAEIDAGISFDVSGSIQGAPVFGVVA